MLHTWQRRGKNAYRGLAGNPEEMGLFGRPKPTK
jgi:hypothetical protein